MPLDPTLGELSDQQTMTHYAPQPNPARPYLDAVSNFFAPFFNPAAHGGITGTLEGAGHQLPDWAAAPQSVLNNPSANQAFLLEAGIPWTAKEFSTLKSMLEAGKLDFSQLPNRSPGSVYKKIHDEGLGGQIWSNAEPYVQRGSPTISSNQEMVEQINKMLKQKMTFQQMAEKLGVSEKSIRRYINEDMGIRTRLFGLNWNDPKRIQQYKSMIAKGLSQEQMAKELGTPVGAVSNQLARLRQAGLIDYVPGGGTRTPSMPSFNLPGEPASDPEYEKALADFLQGQQSSPAQLPEINVPSLEELFDQLTTKRKP